MTRTSDWPHTLTPAAVHILLALADTDRHGLGIVDEVERRTGGHLTLGPGTLYGTVKRLREAGFIEDTPGPREAADGDTRRRYYGITAAGRRALRAEMERLEAIVLTARRKAVLGPSGDR